MKLFLIRHGQTETSGETYAGRIDVPLNDAGRQQALNLSRELSKTPISLILTSPLARAIETAQPLGEMLGLDPLPEPALMELDFGLYEGRRKAELGLTLRKTHAYTPTPSGESLHDVWVRSGEVLQRLFDESHSLDVNCALVGHYWINRLLMGRVSGLSFDEACRSPGYRPVTGSCVELYLSSQEIERPAFNLGHIRQP